MLLQNPWPHFVGDADWEFQVEVVSSEVNSSADMLYNTGYFLAKPTRMMMNLFNESLYADVKAKTTAQVVINKLKNKLIEENVVDFLNETAPPRQTPLLDDRLVFRMKPILEFPVGSTSFVNFSPLCVSIYANVK